ncbi:MAG TPA: hypothetical protein DG753_03065 [Clostridium sp.]|nr:hypothetical protein [Clostridium sp.]
MNSKRNIINWCLLIFWMGVIFYMSNQPANISDSQSFKVMSILESLNIDVNGIFGELANFIVRKCAHFLEYMILGFLIMNVVRMYYTIKISSLITLISVFLYACTDEFHQLFVPGREGAFRDVMIDTCGGLTFILFYILFRIIQGKYLKNKSKN